MAPRVNFTFDATDPSALASFWAEALGYVPEPPPEGYDSWEQAFADWDVPKDEWGAAAAIVDPAGVGPRFFFQRVPEGKSSKNRLHVDVGVSDGPDAEVEERRPPIEDAAVRLEGLGATKVGPVEEDGGYWIVMLDPEGNEFCLT